MSIVLILEDNPEWQEIFIERIKRHTTYRRTDLCSNLEDAIKKSRKTDYGLYLCDDDFPLKPNCVTLKGAFLLFYEELSKIKKSPNIVLSSMNLENINLSRKLGIDGYPKMGNDWHAFIERIRSNQPEDSYD
jgi:hypothetical protein